MNLTKQIEFWRKLSCAQLIRIALFIGFFSALMVGILYFLEQNSQRSAKEKSVGESIQVIMQDLCKEEVQRFCPSAHGIETYSCIKSIDPKFLSAKCLSAFQ